MSIETQKACIQMDHVSFAYGNIHVLENITTTINHGDYVGIVGPNGGGKTTLLKLITGLLTPSSGEVLVFGKKASYQNGKRMGYVPQKAGHTEALFPATVEEIVASGRSVYRGLLRKLNHDDHKAMEEALDITQLTHYRHRRIGNLSGGQRQRVFIARSLTKKPELLILDEPTEGVDIATKETFYELLDDLNQKFDLTIIMVSHDIDVVAKQVKTVLCLNKKLVCQTTPQQFLSGTYIEETYGKNTRAVLHGHNQAVSE